MAGLPVIDPAVTPFGRSMARFALFPRDGELWLGLLSDTPEPPARLGYLKLEAGAIESLRADPSKLTVETERGRAEFAVDGAEVLRIRANMPITLRAASARGDSASNMPGGVELGLSGAGKLLFFPIKGGLRLDSGWDLDAMRPTGAAVELTPEDGELEAGARFYTASVGVPELVPFDQCVQESGEDYRAFMKKIRPFPPAREQVRRRAALALWLSMFGPREATIASDMRSPMVFSRRLEENYALAADQCLAASAFSDDGAAVALAGNIFSCADENGALPWKINDGHRLYGFFPPLFPVALSGRKGAETLYGPLCRLRQLYRRYRQTEGGVPFVAVNTEALLPSADVFSQPLPLATPSHTALMAALDLELAGMAVTLGMPTRGHMEDFNAALRLLTERMWDGKRFCCLRPLSGQRVHTESIDALVPVILGRRLPPELLAALVTSLEEYRGEYGLYTQKKGTEGFDPASPCRGAADMALHTLIIPAIWEAGERSLARKLALSALKPETPAACWNPETGAPISGELGARASAGVLRLGGLLAGRE